MKETLVGCFDLFFDWLKEKEHYKEASGVYSDALVMWMMTYQRLHQGASLLRAIDAFGDKRCWELAGDCKRTKERKISSNTGGYAQARSKLPIGIVEQACDDLFFWLRETQGTETNERALFALDGTTIELLHSKELVKKYPTNRDKGYYPLMRLLVCHDLKTGLAMRPEYGSMYGEGRVGEIELTKRIINRIPANSIITGDRNFGIFCTAYLAQKAGLDVVLRLQDSRAKKILGSAPADGIDRAISWFPSTSELKSHQEIASDAVVHGRIICMNVKSYKGDKITPLYLFTTLQGDVQEIIGMYGLRWNIETDLRSLKKTVNMEMLTVNSEDMALKEISLGICAYNLVRTVIKTAALKIGVLPREISFTRALFALQSFSKYYIEADTQERRLWLQNQFLIAIKAGKHPKRSRKRVEPRAVVRTRRHKFPTLNTSRSVARKALIKN